MIVHRAKDAAEAVKIVIDIAGAKQASTLHKTLIAKSKSMVTEEINLNHALEGKGMRVVETDFGEFIVQLRGERPSHIITPALHLSRRDVGEAFHKKLGIDFTEDISSLTNTARKVLREVFLTADVGISGANFAIVETGGICLVTNEGNGRMVTTLPPIHVALIGMERLVPTLDDLALMLSLLPRSATGQKLSAYTQIVNKPFENQQRHFILLDNGRLRLRNSPLRESLYCIRCGSCLNACPVFREIGGHAYKSVYGGPIGSVISAGLFGSEFVPLAQASSLCGACKDACPVDIDLPKLLMRVRAGQAPVVDRPGAGEISGSKSTDSHGLSLLSSLSLRLYARLARSPRLFSLAQTFARLASTLVSPRAKQMRLPAITGWGYSRDFPKFTAKSFRARWDTIKGKQPENRIEVNRYTGGEEVTASGTVEIQDRIARFTEELAAAHGHVHHSEDATQSIVEFLQSRGIDRIHLEPNVLKEDVLSRAGLTFSREPDPAIRVGVTRVVCGIADTGSVLVADGEGSPLHASLLTEIHLAVLHASQIHPSLENAIYFVRESKSAVFITGPSATGDIESVHTIGVHGPGEVHVFLVDG